MLTVLRLLALRWLAARSFGGLVALLALVAVPLAAALKLVGVPLLLVLGLVLLPIVAVLAMIGLPVLVVGGTAVALVVLLGGLLLLGVFVLKIALVVAIGTWLARAVVRLVRGARTPAAGPIASDPGIGDTTVGAGI